MANKRFNFTFEDGYEYEVTVYEGGGICIKNDFGGKILELGRWRMLDVLEILDSVRDDLKAANERYYNPIAKKEVERMNDYIEIHNGKAYTIPEDHVYYKGEVVDIDTMLAREEREAYELLDAMEDERMDGEELTLIMNYPCRFHSVYKGWELYRAWDIVNDHGRMLYFASGFTPSGGLTILQARNLSGIKKRVSEVA